MNLKKEHISYRILTFLLVFTLLVPSAIKLIHVFEHHEHKVCIGGDTTHIHKIDLDCEFQKFQVNNHFVPVLDNYESTLDDYLDKTSYSEYKFLNNHKSLSFSLRGPPVLV